MGADCAAAGNLLARIDVPLAMVAAFEAASGHFGARLLAGLCAGAERGRRSRPGSLGGTLVVREVSWPIVDLRVDWSDADPIAALTALWGVYAPQIDDYVRRALNPGEAPTFGVPGKTVPPGACLSNSMSRLAPRMKFTLRQLAYFIAAAETGSITLASKRASISQPAISTAISHIERELDVQLFLRHHAQGLSLTPAGRTLLREAKQLLKQAEGMYSAAADISHQMRGELSVGWFSTLAPIVMPELVNPFLGRSRIRRFVHKKATRKGCWRVFVKRRSNWPLRMICRSPTTWISCRSPRCRLMLCSEPRIRLLASAQSNSVNWRRCPWCCLICP